GFRRQVEADRDRRKLFLVRDHQRGRGVLELRNGAQRHLRGAFGREKRGGGGARRQRGLGGDRLGAGGRDVELRQRVRIALVLRRCLQNDAVLVGLGIDRGNL